jgi:hypothetical protein
MVIHHNKLGLKYNMSTNRDDVNEPSEGRIEELAEKVFLFKLPNGSRRFKARNNALIVYQFNPYIFSKLVEGNYLDLGFDSFARSSIIHFSDLFGQMAISSESTREESLNKGGSPKTLGVSPPSKAAVKQASNVVGLMNRRQRRNLRFHREESNS